MKLWIHHHNRHGRIFVVPNRTFLTQEDAMAAALSANQYRTGTLLEYYPVVSIQEIEVSTERLLSNLLGAYSLGSWQNVFSSLLHREDPSIIFGEMVPVPQQDPILLD
jgi:hypothetical protein